MKHCFSLIFPSCGSCVSHSHCRECIEGAARSLWNLTPVEEFRVEPEKKQLIIESPSSRDALLDLLDDMGIFAE